MHSLPIVWAVGVSDSVIGSSAHMLYIIPIQDSSVVVSSLVVAEMVFKIGLECGNYPSNFVKLVNLYSMIVHYIVDLLHCSYIYTTGWE